MVAKSYAHRNREEAVNTQLVLLISQLGVTADAESILLHGKHRSDVIFQLWGLRVVIENKFSDTSNAEQIVLEDARKRVRDGIAHIAAATVCPVDLRTTPTTELIDTLSNTSLRYRIVTEAFENKNWFDGTPASLMEALRRAQESLVKDDIVQNAAQVLSDHLNKITALWIGQTGACDRLSRLLGIPIPKNEENSDALERRETSTKVSALVLANAYIFQEQLALNDERVDTLLKLKKRPDPIDATADHWQWIWENINYVPVFQLGNRILDELPAGRNTTKTVISLLDAAREICREQAAFRHDLMGRIYHWLLHDAKYLGTYYTSVPAATLLLKLAFDLKWPNDFGSAKELVDFKVADLACGTGTLLMATAQAITDSFVKTRADTNRSIQTKDLSVLHSTLMQNVLHGYDILPSAVHLTASTLALLAPEVAFRQMNLFVMPIGMDHKTARLGSIDFLDGDHIHTQFSLDNTQLETVKTGVTKSEFTSARVPKLDLCVMNPPFVSSRYGNRLFGSFPEDRPKLQKALSAQARKNGVTVTPGLGAVFVPLADKHTKPGGRIAFVLPIALTTGEAWASVRKLITDRYHLEIVISSHDPLRTSFSENTDLSEVLFIARKLDGTAHPPNTTYISLRKNPDSIHEALDLASRISVLIAANNFTGNKSLAIRSSNALLGEITTLPSPKGTENWTTTIFSQALLASVHYELLTNYRMVIPGVTDTIALPFCRLDTLGTLGYDVRDITDAFIVDKTASQWTPFPAFWNHDAQKVTQIAQSANAYLIARTKPVPGRKLKDSATIWGQSGKILLVSRLRTNTHKVLATAFDQNVLGNTWWSLDASSLTDFQSKSLLLWLNSTLGLLMYYGSRAITQGPWMQMKKSAWHRMPVLDVRSLSEPALRNLAAAYDELSTRTLKPFSTINNDPNRIDIDEALRSSLSLPPLNAIRDLLVREPGLTGR